MELGNFLFGHSRGTYPVTRDDEWLNCFQTLPRLLMGPHYDGYGTEFVCDAFEIHRYYWGDCTCGFEESDAEWSHQHPHHHRCLSSLATACQCGIDAQYQVWRQTHNHQTTCPIVRPNFLYAPMGFSLTWYKYPFRDSYMSHPLSFEDFRAIINTCLKWVQQHPHVISTQRTTRLLRPPRPSAGHSSVPDRTP